MTPSSGTAPEPTAPEPTAPGITAPAGQPAAHEAVLAELSAALFASLPRSDQRRKAADYIRGLLRTPGRKSIRNIASVVGGGSTEQSLHHFVSSSTWDWAPVRRELGRYVSGIDPPQAWVVRPVVIPKAGENCVGVERCYLPTFGQVLNAQRAVGVWAASEELASPVNWRLHLPPSWLTDPERRQQAAIPDDLPLESVCACAADAHLEVARGWDLPERPVVMDGRDVDAAATVGAVCSAAVPLLIRVNSTLRLTPTDQPGQGPAGTLSAHQIMWDARGRRRPVVWRRSSDGRVSSVNVATVTVRVPERAVPPGRPAHRGDLLLVGLGEKDGPWPVELWLTDMRATPLAELVRLTRLIGRVDQAFAGITERLGIRDFAGRSFAGWHRHVTLVSAAHVVAALSPTEGPAPLSLPGPRTRQVVLPDVAPAATERFARA